MSGPTDSPATAPIDYNSFSDPSGANYARLVADNLNYQSRIDALESMVEELQRERTAGGAGAYRREPSATLPPPPYEGEEDDLPPPPYQPGMEEAEEEIARLMEEKNVALRELQMAKTEVQSLQKRVRKREAYVFELETQMSAYDETMQRMQEEHAAKLSEAVDEAQAEMAAAQIEAGYARANKEKDAQAVDEWRKKSKEKDVYIHELEHSVASLEAQVRAMTQAQREAAAAAAETEAAAATGGELERLRNELMMMTAERNQLKIVVHTVEAERDSFRDGNTELNAALERITAEHEKREAEAADASEVQMMLDTAKAEKERFVQKLRQMKEKYDTLRVQHEQCGTAVQENEEKHKTIILLQKETTKMYEQIVTMREERTVLLNKVEKAGGGDAKLQELAKMVKDLQSQNDILRQERDKAVALKKTSLKALREERVKHKHERERMDPEVLKRVLAKASDVCDGLKEKLEAVSSPEEYQEILFDVIFVYERRIDNMNNEIKSLEMIGNLRESEAGQQAQQSWIREKEELLSLVTALQTSQQ